VIFKFFRKQIFKQDLKGILLTCSKENGAKLVVLFFLSKNGVKNSKNEKFAHLKNFYTLCVLTLNLHVAHAYAFHVKKYPFIFIDSALVQL
jgi:hypothetical protein